MLDIYSAFIGPPTGAMGSTGAMGPTGCINSNEQLYYNSFMVACELHNIDDIDKYMNKVYPYQLKEGFEKIFICSYRPTSIDAAKKLLEKNSRLSIRGLKILARIQGHQYYKDLFLLCLMNSTPEEIDNEKLLVDPSNIRKFNIEQLLMFGADVNITNSKGETPLMMACRYGTEEMVCSLIAAGAKIYTENNEGEDAFVYLKLNKHILDHRVIETLLKSQ